MVAQGVHLMPVNQVLGKLLEAGGFNESRRGKEVKWDMEKLKTRRVPSVRGIFEF